MLLGRLRQTGINRYRLFGHTNPEANKGWIYKNFVENKPDNYRLIIAPSTQNIYLPDSFIESMKNAYDPDYYKINVLGEFGDYTKGLIVKGFSNKNIVDIKYLPEQDLHLTCDFNVDPMCWILAHKTDEKVFFFDEICIENTNTQQAIQYFISKYGDHKGRIIINGDASGDNRSTAGEYSNYVIIKNALYAAGFKNVDFNLRNYNPPIKNRIAAWNAKTKNVKGEINIYIDPKCKQLINNCNNLKYKEGTSIVDVPSHSQIKTDRQLKFLEHPFDAASYLVEFYWPVVVNYSNISNNNKKNIVEEFKSHR